MAEYWQDKSSREAFEIAEFIKHYKELHGDTLEIIQKRDRPDYLLRNETSGELYGVELTSVHLSDRSVFEAHTLPQRKLVLDDPALLAKYKQRLIEAVVEKVHKARKGYDLTYPILLSIYVDEYLVSVLSTDEWQAFEQNNASIFRNMSPVLEIIFWPLPDGGAYPVSGSQYV